MQTSTEGLVMAVDKKLEAFLAKKRAATLAAKQLNDGVPGLQNMDAIEAFGEIDLFLKTWDCPCPAFDPYQYFRRIKRSRQLGL